MDEICTLHRDAPAGGFSPATLCLALQDAADEHAKRLHIDFDRMLRDFSCLWMIARARLELSRAPQGALTVSTQLRRPSAAASLRDFSLSDECGPVGRAVQLWVLVDAQKRRMIDLRRVAPLWEIPTPQPENTLCIPRLTLPQLPTVGQWTVAPEEIDQNGHLNNVAYIHHVQDFAPKELRAMTLYFDRECFPGEALRIEAKEGFARILRPDGSESFRCKFE